MHENEKYLSIKHSRIISLWGREIRVNIWYSLFSSCSLHTML